MRCILRFFLILGISVYLLFNHKPYFIQCLDISLPLLHSESFFERLLVCYGADISWSASFCFAIQAIYCFKSNKTYRLLLCTLLGIGYEILQMVNVVGGTFDPFDIAAYTTGTIIAIVIIKLIRREKDEKQ